MKVVNILYLGCESCGFESHQGYTSFVYKVRTAHFQCAKMGSIPIGCSIHISRWRSSVVERLPEKQEVISSILIATKGSVVLRVKYLLVAQ